jgi:predicted PurR-regulated permease PerM
MQKLHPTLNISLKLLSTILLIYGIIMAKTFLYPIAFGVLFAYLLYPLVNYIEHKGVHRVVSILISIILALAIITLIFFLFYRQLLNMFNDFDTLQQNANRNIENLQQNLKLMLGLKDNRIEEFLKQQVNYLFSNEAGVIKQLFSSTTGVIAHIVILPIYVFLFLFYRTKFAYFILKISKKNKKRVVLKILRDISTIAAKYMGGVTLVVLILCVLNSVGLLIIGVKYAILLGILSAFFNYIPYFGTLMGGSIPLIFVLLTTNEPLNYGLQVAILFIIVQFTENNILTPNIVGGNVRLNPFFIIMGLVFGNAIWGIPGMLVIVPTLAIARVIFSNIDSLNPYAFLLGPRGTQKHSITLHKIKELFVFRKKKS